MPGAPYPGRAIDWPVVDAAGGLHRDARNTRTQRQEMKRTKQPSAVVHELCDSIARAATTGALRRAVVRGYQLFMTGKIDHRGIELINQAVAKADKAKRAADKQRVQKLLAARKVVEGK
jgi:hypothetical protein